MLRRTVLAGRFTTTPPTLMQASRLALAKSAKKPQQRAAKTKKPPVAPPETAPVESPSLVEVDVPQTKCTFDRWHNPLDALSLHIEKDTTRTNCFERGFRGKFLSFMTRRAVLFLTGPGDREKCSKSEYGSSLDEFQPSRLSAARKVTVSLRSEWDPTWSKLLVVTGPPRCGKTHVGLFGLANRRRLTIYIRTESLFQSVGQTGTVSAEVARCIAEAAVHQRIADDPATVDPWARDDAAWAARRYHKDAVVQHLLDLVEERVGKRSSGSWNRVPPKDVVRAIFFFDDFDRGAEWVRRAVLDIASGILGRTRRSSALTDRLSEDFGFKVHGIAVAGTRLATAEGTVQDPHTQLSVSAIGVARDDVTGRVTEAFLPLVQGPELLDEAAERCGQDRWTVDDEKRAVAAEAKLRELSSMRLFTHTPADADELAGSLAEFLSAAADTSRGAPLAQFASVLNEMFSPSTQFDGMPIDPTYPPVTAMRAPAGLETHRLSGTSVLPHERVLRRDFANDVIYEHMVLHKNNVEGMIYGDDAHATVQLVLRVGGIPQEFVSFNFRCFVPSLCDSASDFLRHAHAQRHATAAMKGDAKDTLATPRSVQTASHHGGFIPVFGLHGPQWVGDGWYVKIPVASQIE